jgi:hypothetical protein
LVEVGDKSFVPLNALVDEDPNWLVELPYWLVLLPYRFVEPPGVVPTAPEAEPDWSAELPVAG